MLFKAVLTFLAVGALSVSALTVSVARSLAPELESRELEARMLRRDLSYALLSRELQALDELLSREPEDWAEGRYMAKRQGRKTGTPQPLGPSMPVYQPVQVPAPAPSAPAH